ncbi:AcaB family transcriptional regulator [Enterovibrio norvegicus]|uniref:AcaB family transcriptional regulator n=1 Tax=Enterovibrio norvegicus TaxID=188144 RepID=UPI000C830AD2|nr:AcaB family transcriptional regulator [Enterovibrio norvegicus]PMH64565.1 hypothetical protein BCU62_16040 [Enterovibrio norvegicus]
MTNEKAIQKTDIARQAKPETFSENIGENSVTIKAELTENRPTVPHVEIKFNTKAAPQLLFSSNQEAGSRKNSKARFIQGADWFDTKLRPIMHAIRDDDPFADQVLFDIETAVADLGMTYKAEQENIKALLETRFSNNSAVLKFNENMHCSVYKVTFENRLAYDLLWAVKELDNVLYYLFLADKYSILPVPEISEKRDELRKKYRKTLMLINNWKSTSITRDDLAHNTARVAKTFEVNSNISLSLQVLMLEVRAACAPEIKSRKGNVLIQSTKEKLLELYQTG